MHGVWELGAEIIIMTAFLEYRLGARLKYILYNPPNTLLKYIVFFRFHR